jgi:hypothetical protein
MVLRAASAPASSTDVDDLAAPFSEDRSVWTVDLAVLLASRGVRGLAFFTALAGVADGHARLDFYQRLDRDRERVPRQFARLAELAAGAARPALAGSGGGGGGEGGDGRGAHPDDARAEGPLRGKDATLDVSAGDSDTSTASVAATTSPVQLRVGERVPRARLLAALAARRAVFVALVDARLLRCAHCAAPGASVAASYRGHFVVLTGFDAACGLVEYADPSAAACAPRCVAPADDVERARSAEGTDDDVIEVDVQDVPGPERAGEPERGR